METKIDNLIKAVNEIKTAQNKIVSIINTQSANISYLTSKVNDFTSKFNMLSIDIESSKQHILVIEDIKFFFF